MFVSRFTWLAKTITFESFSLMVDDALKQMEKMLQSNAALKKWVLKEGDKANE